MNLANFRELGGLENRDGKHVSHKRLLRSGELYQMNEEAKKLLEDYHLATIVDLRGEDEIQSHPDDIFQAVDYVWIDIMKEVEDTGSLHDLTRLGDPEAVNQHMLKIYHHLVMNEGAQQGYQRYFEELLKTESGSVLFHCFAGKDRTGIAAALTLELLDVPRELIYQDYLKTNVSRQAPNKKLYAAMKKQGMTKEQLAGMKVALEVRKEYLEQAYQLIDENYGNVLAYAKGVLNVSKSDIKELQKLYLSE